MPRKAVVVGAGIVGLLTGIELARQGVDTAILEAEEPGSGASSRNAGVIHVIQPPPGRLRRRLAHEGRRLYPWLLEALGVESLETRLIIPAFTRRQEAILPPLALALRALSGGERVWLADETALRRLEPALAPGARRGVIVEGYRTLDPRVLIDAILEEAEHHGIEITGGVRVERIQCSSQGVAAHAGDSTVEASVLVNAAGAGAAGLAVQAGLEAPVTLAPGAMTLHRNPGVESIIAWPPRGLARETKGGAVIPWPGGRLLMGPTLTRPGGRVHGPGEVVDRYRGLLGVDPGPVEEYTVGYRTVHRRRDFVLEYGRGSCRRSVHALGIESPGLTAAPALAARLSRMALEALSW